MSRLEMARHKLVRGQTTGGTRYRASARGCGKDHLLKAHHVPRYGDSGSAACLEADHRVLVRRGLDVCQPGAVGTTADFLSLVLETFSASLHQIGDWKARHPR